MSDFDGLRLCENCGDAYTLGRLCRSCREQEMIDAAEPPAPAEPSALEQAERRIAELEAALKQGLANVSQHIRECDQRIAQSRKLLIAQHDPRLEVAIDEEVHFRNGLARAYEHLASAQALAGGAT